MLLGAFFVALAGFLTRIRSGGRHSRRRRRVWRRQRSNYRSRPQWKGPTRRQQDQHTSTINEQSVSSENRLRDNASDSASQVNNDHDLTSAEYVQPNDATMRNTRAWAPIDAPGAGYSTNASCGTSSFKPSTNPSEKCLLTTSGLTQDSGYTDQTSVNSMNLHVHDDTVPVQLVTVITASKEKPEHNVEDGIPTSNAENVPHHVLKTAASGSTTYNKTIKEASDVSGSRSSSVKELVLNSSSIDHNVQEGSAKSGSPPTSQTQGFEADTDDTDPHVEMTESEIEHAVSDAGISTPDCDGIFCSNSLGEAKHSNIEPEVYQRVECGGVALEKMTMTPDGSAVVGSILVRNECYEKQVAVHHSSNAWKTFEDTPAEWVESVAGGSMDRFNFHVQLPDGSYSVEMAFSFNEKWDNNNTKNYTVTCTTF